jgi:hypothetical protein
MVVIPTGDVWPSDEYSNVVLEAFDLNIELEGIAIMFSNPPQLTADETDCWCLVKEIVWEGRAWKEHLVQLASATTGAATTLHAPNTLIKLGSKRIKRLGLGQTSQHRALNAARYFLRNGISRLKVRTYALSVLPTPLPERGKTYQAMDGFAGVCLSRQYTLTAARGEELEVRLCDMSSGADD